MSDKNRWVKRQSEVHPHKLLEKMNIQRCRGDYCDVTVVVQRMRFRGHRCVLSAASKKLHQLISSMKPFSSSSDIGHELFIQEISPQGFKILLEYVYTGTLLIPPDCFTDVSTAAAFLDMEEAMHACVNFDPTQTDSKELGQLQQHDTIDNGLNVGTSSKQALLDSGAFGGLLSQNEGGNDGQEVAGNTTGSSSLGTPQDNGVGANGYGSYPDQDALSEISVQNEDDVMYQTNSGEDLAQRNGLGTTGNQTGTQYPYHHYVPPIEQTFSPRPMPKMLSTHMTILPGMLPSQTFFQDQTQGGQFPVDTYYLTSQAGQFYSGSFVQDQTRALSDYSNEQNLSSQSYVPQPYQSGNEGHQRVDSYGAAGNLPSQGAAGGYQQPANTNYTGLEYGDNVHLYNDGGDIALVGGERELQQTQAASLTGRNVSGKDTGSSGMVQPPLSQEKQLKPSFREKSGKSAHNSSSLKPGGDTNKYFINISPTVQETSSNPFIEAISPYNPDVEIGGSDPIMDTTGSSQIGQSLTGNSHVTSVAQGASIMHGTSSGQGILHVSSDTRNKTAAQLSQIAENQTNIKSDSSTSQSRATSTNSRSKENQSSSSFSGRPAARMPPKKAGYRGIDSDYNKHFAEFSMQHSQQNYEKSHQSKHSDSVTGGYETEATPVIGQVYDKQGRSMLQEAGESGGMAGTRAKSALGCREINSQENPLDKTSHMRSNTLLDAQSKDVIRPGIGSQNEFHQLLQNKPYSQTDVTNPRQTVQLSPIKAPAATRHVPYDSGPVKATGSTNLSEDIGSQRRVDKPELPNVGSEHLSNSTLSAAKSSSLFDRESAENLSSHKTSLASHSNILQSKSNFPSLPDPQVVHIQTKKMAAIHAAKVANGMAPHNHMSQTMPNLSQAPHNTSHTQLQNLQLSPGPDMELGNYRNASGNSMALPGDNDPGARDDSQIPGGKAGSDMSTVDTASIDEPPAQVKRPNLPLDQSNLYNTEAENGGDLTMKSGGGNLTPNKNCNVVDLVDCYIEDYLRSIDQSVETNQSPVKVYQQPVNQTTGHHTAQQGPMSTGVAGSMSSGGASNSYTVPPTCYTNTHNNTNSTAASAYNYPGSNGAVGISVGISGTGASMASNSMSYSVEEVSKTILNVLSQECFDDDSTEGNLQTKGPSDPTKKHQESVPLTTLLKMVPFHKAATNQMEGHGHLTQYAEITSSQENVDRLIHGHDSECEDDDMVPRFEDIESGSDNDSNYNLVIDFDKEIHEEENFIEGSQQLVTVEQKGLPRNVNKKLVKTPTKTSTPSKGEGHMRMKTEGSGSRGELNTNVAKGAETPRKPATPKVTKKTNRRFLSPMKIPRYMLTTDYREDPEARPGHKSQHRSADEIVKPPKKRIKLKLLMTKLQDDNLTVTRKMLQKKPHKRKIKYICELCQREFWDRYKSFADHMQDHMQNELNFCKICGKGYKRMEDLSRHRAEYHDLFSFQCQHCDEKFSNSLSYKKHSLGTHQEKRPFYCVFEGCVYRSEKFNELEKHLLVHSVEKQFACPHCSKKFSQPNGLRSHLTTCMNMQSYVCPICSKSFNRQQGLRDHMSIHEGKKEHECKECGASFSDPRNLGRHVRTHSSETKYACKHCDLKFKFSNCLKRHITRKHPDKETVQVGKKGGRNKQEVLVQNYSATQGDGEEFKTGKK